MISFWEDYYRKHPLEARKDKDGEVYFETGDPYIDKWEKEISMGLTPDLLEDLPSKHREAQRKDQEAKRKTELLAQISNVDQDGFAEDYLSKLKSTGSILGSNVERGK
jgi:hypothetical protein